MVAVIIIGVFIVSFLYAHSRGKEKQKLTRQLFDHSTFMGPINMFMTGFSRLPARQPYFDEKGFPELQTLTDNWQVIREEAVRLQHHIKKAQSHNDAGFNTFFKRGWKRFYLKWYSDSHPSAQALCPKPSSCSTASRRSRPRCSPSCRPAAIWVNTAILTPARCAIIWG